MRINEPEKIDDYINNFTPEIQAILQTIRKLVKKHAPNAYESISYGIPTFFYQKSFFYYAAFKNHFSLFPPITGSEDLLKAIKPYANEKNNLLFKYKDEIPYGLIEKVILNHIAQLKNN